MSINTTPTYKAYKPWSQTWHKYTKDDVLRDLEYMEDVVVADSETTGVKKDDEITELAIVDYLSGDILIDTFLKPSWYPDELSMKDFDDGKASEVSHIKSIDLLHAPTFPDIYKQFCEILRTKRIAIFNAYFDGKMFLRTAYKWNLALPQFETLDVMKLVQYYFGLADYPSLDEACELFSITRDEKHQARIDVFDTIRVIDSLRSI